MRKNYWLPTALFIVSCFSFSYAGEKFSCRALKKYLHSLDADIKIHGKVKEKNFCSNHSEDLLQIVFLLQWETIRNPNRHILTMFDEIKKIVRGNTFLRTEIEKLICSVCRPTVMEPFPYENIAYQSLVLFIKTWRKRDLHCHVSPSLSASWVIDTVRKNWETYKQVFFDRIRSRKWQQWRDQEKNTVTGKVIKAFVDGKKDNEIERMFMLYENPTDAFDIPIKFAAYNNLDFFLDAVRYVVRRYFDDGVRLVELRFNPCKKFHNISYPASHVLQKVSEVVNQEEFLANQRYGGEHHTKFMLSFNQANYANKKDIFRETIKKSMALAKSGACSSRMVGVDLSGPESEKTRRSLWSDLFDVQPVYKSGGEYEAVSHVGDRWNVDDAFNDNIDKHLEYVEDALSIKKIKRLGHCNILWPDYCVVRPYKDCALRVFDPDITKRQKDKIQEILKIIKQRAITISALPKTELQTIPVMKKFPFYYWWKEGVSVCVGIDGTSYTRSMLSEWITWLLLAAPRYETDYQASITVAQMKKIVCI
jgi:adenosine deaminase